MKISGTSQKQKKRFRLLIENNRLEEAFRLLQKLTYQEHVIDEISAQLGRLKRAQTSKVISEEHKTNEINKLRHAIYSLLEDYEDDFPHLSCDYTDALKRRKQITFDNPTDATPIFLCFIVDLSQSMFGKAKDIEALLHDMGISFNELSHKLDYQISASQPSKSIQERTRVSIIGMGMSPMLDKLLSFFGDDSSRNIPPVNYLLRADSLLLSEIISNWKIIKSDISSASKGGNYSHIREAWDFARNTISSHYSSSNSLKVIFTISDGEWGNEEVEALTKTKEALEEENILIFNGLVLDQNKIPYKYLPTSAVVDNGDIDKIISLSSNLPNNLDLYRTLNELQWEFEPMESRLCIQLNEYSVFNEIMEALINTVKK